LALEHFRDLPTGHHLDRLSGRLDLKGDSRLLERSRVRAHHRERMNRDSWNGTGR
jgi:hypothetical protein